jgi:uncharacterized protein (DUF433 family)
MPRENRLLVKSRGENVKLEALAKPIDSQGSTGILPVFHGRDAHATRGFARTSLEDLKDVIHSDPNIMGGTPVFVGTRVPFQNLIDYLEGGESIEDFLDGFPTVKREQVLAVLEAGKFAVLETV